MDSAYRAWIEYLFYQSRLRYVAVRRIIHSIDVFAYVALSFVLLLFTPVSFWFLATMFFAAVVMTSYANVHTLQRQIGINDRHIFWPLFYSMSTGLTYLSYHLFTFAALSTRVCCA